MKLIISSFFLSFLFLLTGFYLKQDFFELIPEVSEFDERIEEIAAARVNWLKEKCMICPRIEKNDMIVVPE